VSRPLAVHRRASGRGAIEAAAFYPIAVFMRRLGIGRHSFTALRRQGLPVRPIGTRLFIDGEEALAFLRRLWREQDQGSLNSAKGTAEHTRCEGE
jgi:hypothetical protein